MNPSGLPEFDPFLAEPFDHPGKGLAINSFGSFSIHENGLSVLEKLSDQEKEFLALLLVHSEFLPSYYRQNNAGIDNRIINNTIWPDADGKTLRNRKGVVLNKLKNKLSAVSGVRILYNGKMHRLEMTAPAHFDFKTFLKYKDALPVDETALAELLGALKGPFFAGIGYQWLDDFQANIDIRCINMLSKLLHSPWSLHAKTSITRALISYDNLNYDAGLFMISYYKSVRQFSIAKTVYDRYNRLYLENFSEKFPLPYEVISKNLEDL